MKRILSFGLFASFLCATFFVSAHSGEATEKTAGVTFTKDVAPIIFNKCATCHRSGEGRRSEGPSKARVILRNARHFNVEQRAILVAAEDIGVAAAAARHRAVYRKFRSPMPDRTRRDR